jgi:hypothetical protein
MKIVKASNKKSCTKCGCEFKFKKEDIERQCNDLAILLDFEGVRDATDDDFIFTVKCPVCGTSLKLEIIEV